MRSIKILLLVLLASLGASAQVQQFGFTDYTMPYRINIGAGVAKQTHNSAYLEVGTSNSKRGILFPRGYTDSIAVVAEGLMIYDLKGKKLKWYNGTQWDSATSAAGSLPDTAIYATKYHVNQRRINTIAVTGTTSKVVTVTLVDGTVITSAAFTDLNTSTDSAVFATKYFVSQNYQPIGDYLTTTNGYTKTEIQNILGGGVTMPGYNKTQWDAAYSWGNHAGLYPTISRFMDSVNALRTSITAGSTGSGTVNSGSQYRIGIYNTAGTTISAHSAITPNRALASDANGLPVHTLVTDTELGYIAGLTSNAQTQINGKLTGNSAITGATRTKITFDSKGLVTGGADATTSDIAEGSNLYYTTARFNTSFATKTTTDLAEGTNLYFTQARVRSTPLTGYAVGANTALAATDDILAAFAKIQAQINAKQASGSYQTQLSGTGFIKIAGTTISYDNNTYTVANAAITGATKTKITYDAKGLVTAGEDATTTDIAEGSNLYYTDARVRAATLTGLSTASTTPISSTDNVLIALGRLQGQINALPTTSTALLRANNLSDLNSSPTALTNLGGTTVGKNIFTAINPSAVRWIRVNADNSITFRTAAETLSDIGAQASGSYQSQLSGNGFIKIAGTTISYDNNSYTVANTAIAGATKTKITYDAKGLITAGADATTSDIAEGSNLYYTTTRFNTSFATKTTTDLAEGSNLYFTESRVRSTPLTGYSVGTNTALATTDNVLIALGKLQAQINAAGSGSGNVTTGNANRLAYYQSLGNSVTELAAISANRALISDANGLPTHSSITSTELNFLSGVTSNIQTQFGGKITANAAIAGATKTKITYDSKGLVTGGADATTSDIAEGSNLYHTEARVRSATLTGLSTATNAPISATDNMLAAIGKLQAQISSFTGVTDGNKGEITVNTGQWTINNSAVTNVKVAPGIDAAKVGDGSVSNTEFGYIGTLTSDAQAQINNKLTGNSAITGATKTKITYDSKGLVTAGADATTSDIAEGSNLYHTSARVRATDLAGLSTATATAVAATDNVLTGIGKLQGQINAIPSVTYPGAGIPVSTGSAWGTSIADNSTNWNTAYSDRLKWDGGSTGLTPATGRNSLGATTVGSNFFTLTNPSAITFPRINADNTVSALDAATFRSAIGAGTSSNNGTVTSASVVSANGFAGSVATSTSTPAITLTTTVTGLLKGNGTAISAVTANTETYTGSTSLTITLSQTPITGTDQYWINNVLIKPSNVSRTGTSVTFTLPFSRETGDEITAKYMY